MGILFVLGVVFFYIFTAAKVLEKAGKNGWLVLVPVYNVILFCEVAGFSTLETVLMFVPFVNVIMIVMFSLKLAKRFGKSDGFGVGLWLLAAVFYPILAFGDASYQRA